MEGYREGNRAAPYAHFNSIECIFYARANGANPAWKQPEPGAKLLSACKFRLQERFSGPAVSDAGRRESLLLEKAVDGYVEQA
jgi:hypothetical protein